MIPKLHIIIRCSESHPMIRHAGHLFENQTNNCCDIQLKVETNPQITLVKSTKKLKIN